MKQIQAVRLTFTAGSSDKEYRLHLIEDKGSYVVNFQYGRRNGTLKGGTKTASPVSKAEAEKIFNKYLKEKTSEGYVLDGASATSTPSLAVVVPRTKDATLVQLLKEIKDDAHFRRCQNSMIVSHSNFLMHHHCVLPHHALLKAPLYQSIQSASPEASGHRPLSLDLPMPGLLASTRDRKKLGQLSELVRVGGFFLTLRSTLALKKVIFQLLLFQL